MQIANGTLRRLRRYTAIVLVATLAVAIAPNVAAAAAPTGVAEAITPTNGGTVSANPILHWSAVAGAAKYRVQVATTPTFDNPLLWTAQGDTYNRKATVPTNLPVGTIHWRVAAINAAGEVGNWGTFSFNREWSDAPELLAPHDGAVLDYPVRSVNLRWNPLPGAKTYRVQVDDAMDFEGAKSYVTSSTAYTLTTPQVVNQPFHWRVKAVAATTGLESAWSAPRSYSTRWDEVPQLVSPANQTATEIQDVVLDWDPVPGAATYELQISPDDDFSTVIQIASNGVMRGTRYSPAVTLANGAYYWRVRARDAKVPANEGRWSDTWTFGRGWPHRPTLLTPTDGDVTAPSPAFSWTPAKHASSYVIQVGTNEHFSPNTFSQCVTNQTSYTPYVIEQATGVPTAMPNSGTCNLDRKLAISNGVPYFWRVQAVDNPRTNLMMEGLWSDTFQFVHEVPTPTILAPADGATVETPVLKWNPVPGQGRYRVVIHKAAGGTAVTNKLTYATSFTPTEDLRPVDGPFTWYVVASSPWSGESPVPMYSSRRSFSLVEPASPGDTATGLTPADGTTSSRMPSMTWEPVAGAHHYRVYYRSTRDALGTWHVFPEEIHQAGYTFMGDAQGGTIQPGDYTWFAQAEGATDLPVGLAGAHKTFTVTAPVLATESYLAPQECEVGDVCAVGHTPQMVWEGMPDAGSYYVYMASDPMFTTIVGRYWTNHTSLTPRESYIDSQAGQSYYWLVRPCIDVDYPAHRCGPYDGSVFPLAPAFRKQSAAVVPLSPADGAIVTDEVTFEWEDYLATNYPEPAQGDAPRWHQEAKQYRIQVSAESDFSPLLESAKTVDQTTYTPHDTTYPNGPIYWRVQAIDNSNNILTQSPTQSLTKVGGPVTTIAPADDGVVTGLPTMRWESRQFAADYNVQLFKAGNPNPVVNQMTKLTAYAPTVNLEAGTYTWRVQWIDASGHIGTWANGGTFTLQPDLVQLTAPVGEDLITTHTMVFTWMTMPTAVGYRLQTSTSPSFTSPFEQPVVSAPAWAPTKLYPDGQYWWRVQALDGSGNVLSSSSTRTFTKQEGMATALTLTRSVTTLMDPDTVTLSGVLKRTDTGSALYDKTVWLYGRKTNSTTYAKLGTDTTDRNGAVSFSHVPRQHWVYQLRYPTVGAVTGANSPARQVSYRPRVTADLEKTGLMRGDWTRMVGTISPYYAGRTIYLQKRVSGKWSDVAAKALGSPLSNPSVIKFAFRVAPGKKGAHYYRVRFPARTKVHRGVLTLKETLTIF